MLRIGRNDPCPCGSGKKFKKCCLVLGMLSPPQEPSPFERKLWRLISAGYDAFERKQWRQAIPPWLEAWELLKPELREASVTDVSEIDDLLDLGVFALNWTQDLSMALQNATVDDDSYYRALAQYTEEFVSYLPDSGLTTQNMRRSHAEALYFCGEPERGEAAFRQVIRDYPGWAWGYIGFADVHWLFRPDYLPIDYERALSLYKEGLENNEDPGDVIVFEERLVDLAEEAGWSYEEIVKDLPRFGRLSSTAEQLAGPGTRSEPHRMTFEEFSKLPEQPGLQLIDGLLVKEPSPRYGHQAIIGQLYLKMAPYVNERGLGRVILAPFDVVLANDQVLQPDLIFVSGERLDLIQENGLFGAPDLVVEVLSPSSRRYDKGRKRELYFEYGCSEMWIVDPDESTLILSVRARGGWEDTLLTRDDVLVSPTLKRFRLHLSTLAPR